jgi:CMP-N,N'-diacetyllegionaminic acid synthase
VQSPYRHSHWFQQEATRTTVVTDYSQVGKVLALIPARSGSKSIPDKNVRLVGGKPLIAWSIEYARASELVDRTIVSTDSEAYAQIAREYGAEVPVLRPPELAGDLSTDLECFQHMAQWLKRHEGYVPDLCVHLRPTYPLREAGRLDDMLRMLADRPDADSVRTVTEVIHPPYKMWHCDDAGSLTPVLSKAPGVSEPWNAPRQCLPKTYIQNANIDIVRTSVITDGNSMSGSNVLGYVESNFYDIDTLDELERVATRIHHDGTRRLRASTLEHPKTFCFDIDGVIATLTLENDYTQADPRWEIIGLIRRLHKAGHRIILFTARGTTTGIDWRSLTMDQLSRWDVPFDELRFGKPAADFYIDDRMLSFDQLDEITRHVMEVCV